MSDGRAKELLDLGGKLFTAKLSLDSLFQEIAENFYPERADFTRKFTLGEEFADHLHDSYPVMMRRELGNSFSAMMRPRERPWFKIKTGDEETDADPGNARYMEYLTKKIRVKIYYAKSNFVGATKGADHDFATFGQCVLSVEESPGRDNLFFQGHHLRDCAWLESPIKEVDHLHRRDAMTARQMYRLFRDKVHSSVKACAEKDPGKELGIHVVCMPTDEYDYVGEGAKDSKGKKLPFVAIYIDKDNCKVLRESPLLDFPYVVPRWHRISGTQYAFSPATMIALPDARMTQQMARILLEAGEKSVDPPLIGVEDAVRDIDIRAGSVSWLDYAYDERLGAALRPLDINADMRSGFALKQDMRDMLAKAFFVDKLNLPPVDAGKMTATEIQRRYEEYVRNLLPLFEPMETEYNAKLLDKAFAKLWQMKVFDRNDIPDALSNADLVYEFDSPIQTAASQIVVQQFQEVLALVGASAQAAQVGTGPVNLDTALKDAIRATGAPAKWRHTDEELAAMAEQRAAEQAVQEAAMQVNQAAEVTGNVANAAMQVDQAMMPPQARGGNVVPMKPKARAAA